MLKFQVKETLEFHARVRMDRELTQAQRKLRVEAVIREMGLKKSENTVIGIEGRIKGDLLNKFF